MVGQKIRYFWKKKTCPYVKLVIRSHVQLPQVDVNQTSTCSLNKRANNLADQLHGLAWTK